MPLVPTDDTTGVAPAFWTPSIPKSTRPDEAQQPTPTPPPRGAPREDATPASAAGIQARFTITGPTPTPHTPAARAQSVDALTQPSDAPEPSAAAHGAKALGTDARLANATARDTDADPAGATASDADARPATAETRVTDADPAGAKARGTDGDSTGAKARGTDGDSTGAKARGTDGDSTGAETRDTDAEPAGAESRGVAGESAGAEARGVGAGPAEVEVNPTADTQALRRIGDEALPVFLDTTGRRRRRLRALLWLVSLAGLTYATVLVLSLLSGHSTQSLASPEYRPEGHSPAATGAPVASEQAAIPRTGAPVGQAPAAQPDPARPSAATTSQATPRKAGAQNTPAASAKPSPAQASANPSTPPAPANSGPTNPAPANPSTPASAAPSASDGGIVEDLLDTLFPWTS
ncbi:hypothetical protein [Cryptosporangium sp. NPDC048952]|uniref:hypothetical protein n=1 Tax=Cryptosporangium sp. NPDC048952 TaxID=3363961 RepID=UPI003713ABA4